MIPNEDASNETSEEAPKEEKVTLLEAAACPGPFSVDYTKSELFIKKRFSFDDEGRMQAVDWLNALYEEKEEFFEDVYLHPDKYYKVHHVEEATR